MALLLCSEDTVNYNHTARWGATVHVLGPECRDRKDSIGKNFLVETYWKNQEMSTWWPKSSRHWTEKFNNWTRPWLCSFIPEIQHWKEFVFQTCTIILSGQGMANIFHNWHWFKFCGHQVSLQILSFATEVRQQPRAGQNYTGTPMSQ